MLGSMATSMVQKAVPATCYAKAAHGATVKRRHEPMPWGQARVMLGTGKEGWRMSASVGALSRLAKITVSGTRRLYELVSFLFPPLGALVSWHWGSTLEASAFGRRASRFIGDFPREGPELVASDRCFWSRP